MNFGEMIQGHSTILWKKAEREDIIGTMGREKFLIGQCIFNRRLSK